MASRIKEDERNERTIRNLLKLPENRRCINCNSLGPQYVCTNFSTFICTTCSGIHREFTHRVKSVSMAKFTTQEVSALQGGGNASARVIYLKEWDPQRNSLPDGSNVERLRDFIKHVYVDRRYTGEKNLEKPLREKMEESNDFNGNKRADSYQGGSRSPPYGSPGYGREIPRNNDDKRSPARPEVVNDWRREDRFGNGRLSDDKSSDGGSKFGGRSPDSQRDSDMSSPPIVRPVREILGDSVSPLRIIEPPKAIIRGKATDISTHTQRTLSSSSLASSDGNSSEVKVEASLIDFNDSVPEVPVTATVPQTQVAGSAAAVQLAGPSGDNWANFDSVPQVKVTTAASNSLESLLQMSIPAPVSAPTSSVNMSPFQPSGSSGPSSGSSFGPAPPSANTMGGWLANEPTGGQWAAMRPQQVPLFPGNSGQPVTQPVIPANSQSSSNMPWNQIAAPNAHGPSGVLVGPAMDNSFGHATASSLNTKSGDRKELPADLFAMNYSYHAPPVSGWYPGAPYRPGVPMQYNMPMAVPQFQPVSRSTNPFDVSNEPSSVQAATFPSMTSVHGALPGVITPSYAPPVLSQAPSYAPAIPPSPYPGQAFAGSMAPRPQGPSGFTHEEPAFTSLYPNHQPGGLHHAHSAPSNFTSTGGNPFG